MQLWFLVDISKVGLTDTRTSLTIAACTMLRAVHKKSGGGSCWQGCQSDTSHITNQAGVASVIKHRGPRHAT